MAHDVFISYSSKDKTAADAVCATLESRKIRCWIAPRDVPAGKPYAASLVNAISESRVFVLVLSEGSNQSSHVLREVGEAVDNGIPVIPLRIEEVEPSQEMRYYIKSIHWLDAMSPPLERHLEKLSDSVQALLSVGAEEQPPPVVESVIEAPAKKRWPLPTWATALILFAVVVIIGGVGTWAILKSGSTTSSSNPSNVASPTEIASPTKVAPTEEVAYDLAEVTSTPVDVDDWRTLSFMIPNPQLWDASVDNRYTAVGQGSVDAFAWSTETFEGDLTVSLELESPESQSSGCVILFGDGHEHSYGSLIFCVDWDFYQLEKHTTYHDGENFVTYSPSNINFKDQVYSVTIEIVGDVASMFVDGQKVLSTFFDTEEIDPRGRIGLYKKYWIGSEITFSNIQIKTPVDKEQGLSTPTDEEWECEIDSGSQVNFFPIKSPFNSLSIEVDGGISSSEEWSDATCADLRMHYSINATNPNFQRIRWWVQNNEQEISFLIRIPLDLAMRGVFIDYFWPEYTGTWAHSDGVYINLDGEFFDHGKWDELQWFEDDELDPPGTIDVQAANSNDGEFYWFEIKRPLKSGDIDDWAFEPGQRIGNNPYDSFLIGIVLGEGEFMRYLQLALGEP